MLRCITDADRGKLSEFMSDCVIAILVTVLQQPRRMERK